jgi:hypothetical protein
MKKTICMLPLIAIICIADSNVTVQQLPVQQPKQDFNQKVFNQLDQKITEIHQALEDAKNAKIQNESNNVEVDREALPIVQGTFSIYKDGRLKKREAYVRDSGNVQMYINGNNNMITKSISADGVEFKAGNEIVKTPLAYNDSQVDKDEELKPTINKYSTQKVVTKADNLPNIEQVISNLNNQKK